MSNFASVGGFLGLTVGGILTYWNFRKRCLFEGAGEASQLWVQSRPSRPSGARGRSADRETGAVDATRVRNRSGTGNSNQVMIKGTT